MSKPLIQLALDFITIPSAVRMAVLASEPVDIVEVGTPLCKAGGMPAVSAIREVCPDKLVVADVKTPDVGALEAEMCFNAGADIMTVIGGAALATTRQALETAKKHNKHAQMELTGVRDIIARAKEWKDVGVEWMVYHRGWDEQGADGREWTEQDLATIGELIDMGFDVTVTGGLNAELVPFFKGLNPKALIFGRSIHQTEDPYRSAMKVREAVEKVW